MPIERAMPHFEPGTLVRVPFPYADRDKAQFRPGAVLGTFGEDRRIAWVLMITSATNRSWPGDIAIGHHAALPVLSVIRTAKIAAIDSDRIEAKGMLSPHLMAAVRDELRERLGF